MLLIAPLLGVVALQSPASAADIQGVPAGAPQAGYTKLIVKKGGDRTTTGVSGLAGAKFRFYRVTSSSTLSGGTLMPDTCTTDDSGQCGIFAQLSGTGDNYFYAQELQAPAGWSIADVWGSSTNYLRYNSGAVRSSSSDRVRYLPPSGRTWPDVRDNPTAPQKCGLDIRMILDVSQSIDNTELQTFKNAAKGVVDNLVGTPSRVSLSRFSSQAADVLSLTSVTTSGGATTVKNAIDNVNRNDIGQYTNWDRALWGSANKAEAYDVALIITDGDPTAYGSQMTGDSADATLRPVEEAIHSANALKAKGTQVIAVGIGLDNGPSIQRLRLISSPDSTYTTTWQTLGADLKAIASGACSKAITVRKVVKDWQGNTLNDSPESNGWQFSGALSDGTIGSFAATAQANGQNGWTQSQVSIPANATPTVTITETLKSGWSFEGATCSVDGQQVQVSPTATPGQFTFKGKGNATMTCTVTNKQDPPAPRLTLVKKVLNADGTQAPASAGQAWTLSATGASGSFSGAGNTAAVTDKAVTAGVQYTLAESIREGYTNGTTWTCVKDSGPGSISFAAPDKLTLAAGQVATCTITNQVKLADLTVSKTAKTSYARDYDWTIEKLVTNGSRFEVPQGTPAKVDYEVVVTPSAPKDSSFKVEGKITVHNPNTVPIAGVSITDELPGASCTVEGGTGPRTIQPGDTEVSYSCTVADATPDTKGTNKAKATWDASKYHGTSGQATGEAAVDFTKATVSTTDATAVVTDSMIDIDGTGPDGVVVHASAGKQTFPYSRNIVGTVGKCTTHDNTATVKPSDSASSSDKETVTVCVGADLEVAKVATLSYEREYKWKVTKTGPGHLFVGANGGTASYDVKLETNGYRDHGWTLGGKIAITNPNSWPVDAHVSDLTTLDGKQLTCTITGGADVTVPANADKAEYAYTCTGVEQGDYSGSNTATVTWDKTEYFTPSASASDTVAVDVKADPSPANASVNLSDVFDGGAATTVGDGPYKWSEVKDNPVTVTYTRPVTGAAGACRTYVNTVSVTGTDASSSATTEVCQPGIDKTVNARFGQRQTWSLKKEVDKTFVELGPNDTVTFNYTVTATPGAVVDEGQASWSGVITVKNPSTTEVFNGTVTDTPDVAGWTCQIVGDGKVSVQPGGSANVSYTCSTAGNTHPDGKNTATVSWPGHSTAKTVDVEFDSTGTIDTKATLTDDIVGDGLPAKTFEVDAAKGPNVFTYSNSTLTADAGKCATWTNHAVLQVTGEDPTASATVKVCREAPLEVEVEGTGNYGVTYPWSLDKVLKEPQSVWVDPEVGQATFDYEVVVTAGEKQPADWTMGGTVTITNPNAYAEGAITVTDLDVTTDLGGGAVCTPTLPSQPIAPGDDVTVPYTCTFTGDPATSGTVTAVATWDPAGPATSDTASGEGDVELTVGEEVDKTIEVWDDKTDPENPVFLGELTWSDGLVKTYTYSLTHDGVPGQCVSYTNTAWLELPSRQGPRTAGLDEGDPSDSTTATVCVQAPLSASIEAAGGLARDYPWTIDKDVDKTSVTISGGSATFNYTVVVRAGAFKDSAWRASGVVTVSNPNRYEGGAVELTGASISNTFGPGVACAPNAPAAGKVVPAAGEGPGTVSIPFTCTFANAPASNTGTISASVTWDPVVEGATGTASASTGVALGLDKETNKVVDVVDDKTVPGQRIVLEKGLVWTAGLVKTYTYSLDLPAGAAGTTKPYTNIATVDLPEGPDVSDTVTVTITVPEVLPEQTFGKATGKVRASCQGTVTARMRNATGARVTYVLKVGKKTHRIKVGSGKRKVFQTKGAARSRVVLKVGRQTLDRVRVPKRCLPPEVLPETGLRAAANARLVWIAERWR